MSIAVSATVVSSRRLRLLVAAFGMANLAAAGVVGWMLPERLVAPLFQAVFFLCAGACLLHAALRGTNTLRVDISGLGQVRLTVQQEKKANNATCAPAGIAAALLPGSTAWPQLLLLLLRAEDGALVALPVLHDSVSPDEFRALSVALRCAGRRDDFGEGEDWAERIATLARGHKIL